MNSLLERGYARVEGLETTLAELGVTPIAPRELFAPRQALGDGTYSAPEWAPDREMCHHHEQSYSLEPPSHVVFACVTAPVSGGEILLADTTHVLEHIPADLLARFDEHGWLLTRAYRPYLGLSWATALGLDDRDAASAWLEANGISYEWGKDGSLVTKQVRPAIYTHPVTKQRCWFNDVAFFSQWALAPAERDVMLKAFGPSGLPFNTWIGDGTALTEPEFQSLLDAYDAVGERVRLEPGERLILDNMRVAHGRTPYVGRLDLAITLAR